MSFEAFGLASHLIFIWRWGSSQHVELEAAKFLHKLIQESKDEPAKLATKLYVICQHMRMSGKEHSLPYQVISRAMETVINQHGLDRDALRSARFPLAGGIGDPGNARQDKDTPESMTGNNMILNGAPVGAWHAASSSHMNEETRSGASQSLGIPRNSNTAPGDADMENQEATTSNRPPVGPNRVENLGRDVPQGSLSQRSKSLDHGSPASVPTEDSRSTNSQEKQDMKSDKQVTKKDTKRTGAKRKRADSKTTSQTSTEDQQGSDVVSTGFNSRKGKQANKGDTQGHFPVGAQSSVQHSSQPEQIPSHPNSSGPLPRAKQEALQSFSERNLDKVSTNALQPGSNAFGPTVVWSQKKVGAQADMSQSRFPAYTSSQGASGDASTPGIEAKHIPHGASNVNPPVLNVTTHMDAVSTFNAGTTRAFNSYIMSKTGFSTASAPTFYDGSSLKSSDLDSKLHKERSLDGTGSELMEKGKVGELKAIGTREPQISSSVSGRGETLEQRSQDSFAISTSEANLSAKFGYPRNNAEMANLRKPPRDTGRVSVPQASTSSNMPFSEHQLKQLRAQCLVFLAFRNNMVPRNLHLEIALADSYSREGHTDTKGKDLSSVEPSSSRECSDAFIRQTDSKETGTQRPAHITQKSSSGITPEPGSSSKDVENNKTNSVKPETSDRSMTAEACQNQKLEAENQIKENAAVNASRAKVHGSELPVSTGGIPNSSQRETSDCANDQGIWMNQSSLSVVGTAVKPEGFTLTRDGVSNDALRETQAISNVALKHELAQGKVVSNTRDSQTLGRGDTICTSNKPASPITGTTPVLAVKELTNDVSSHLAHSSQTENHASVVDSIVTNNSAGFRSSRGYTGPKDHGVSEAHRQTNPDGFKTIIFNDAQKHGNVGVLGKSMEDEDGNMTVSHGLPVSPPKHTTTEKWIMDQQKRKNQEERNWAVKHRKAEERIAKCFDKLKESKNLSEDISAKTKSVIELKKLQLLRLQRRLRSDFLNDFFKPITSDMERLKSAKKHKHGRRMKQLEKFELKMKEERQKRIKERQKEFFSEVEAHKERLEDSFKIKRERWRGFNKHVKEFHKRKERIHREKIDRIQREKINLLKNNDVEGYLRMVQDAKSDRVKQLLKETEKYLQKLGSKLQEAKAMARRFEMEMDESRAVNLIEKNEFSIANEDESDEAQHYLESNEKYYLMAHSVKESINEQPISLQGGKLREYQMNGLRWLVSLYNNNLNGILADEMGLGKTVQVISLICYLMEMKNDRGPFLVVVPSSVLPGWESELSFWAPGINKIAYAGPPEERRRLFKERIVQQKFNVLLTTYEYLMNKHDRPKLSKIQWHYVIIDEGHRIKNASCKLNADLKHYQSSHRLLLTGTPLQNNLEELWALLNFLLPSIFNSAEDFSQWFNKPFESGGDNSPDEALLSEEENLLIINRLHQVLRPFVLRRLKHKVENELPEKIERLVRCEASAYQKLLMKRVEDNLGSIGNSRVRSVHNTVMELRNICNHPYLSQLHAEEVDTLIPKHFLPPIVRLCGKLEMLDRLLPKLKATNHRVLFFSTMTRLLDVMEEYLSWKRYRYLRLDGHTSGNDRGALIEEFNRPDSAAFIFLLSIRAGGVGVNLQAADTVIIFDTDWNPQVDLQAQARAHRIGQKRDVLVLRLETVRTVEEQVRAAAEHKLGVANQSITAGFFDNHTSAEDRREYLEALLRESKKEETAPVLDDDALNDMLARSESEIDIFEAVDKQRREGEMETWQMLVQGKVTDGQEPLPMPSRLVTDEDLKPLYQAIQIYETNNVAIKRKGDPLRGLDTQHYGRGKRAREVRSYEDQWTEEEFEKLCQVESPECSEPQETVKGSCILKDLGALNVVVKEVEPFLSKEPEPKIVTKEVEPLLKEPASNNKVPQLVGNDNPAPVKRGRGRPKRTVSNPPAVSSSSGDFIRQDTGAERETVPVATVITNSNNTAHTQGDESSHQEYTQMTNLAPASSTTTLMPVTAKVQTRRTKAGETARHRARKQNVESAASGPGVDVITPAEGTVVTKKPPGRPPRGRKSAALSAPIPHDVKPISGVHKMAELDAVAVAVQAPTSSQQQEKCLIDLPTLGGNLSEKDVPGSNVRDASLESAPGVDQLSSVSSKKQEMISTGIVLAEGPQLAPATSLVSLNSREEKLLPLESPISMSAEIQKTFGKPENSSLQATLITSASDFSVVSVSPVLRSDGKTQVENNELKSVHVDQSKDVYLTNTSLQATQKTSASDFLVASVPPVLRSDSKAQVENNELKSVQVDQSKDGVHLSEVHDIKAEDMKCDASHFPAPVSQVSASVEASNTELVVVRRRPERKASVTSKKAAAREAKIATNSSVSAHAVHAQLAGLNLDNAKHRGSKSSRIRGEPGKHGKESASKDTNVEVELVKDAKQTPEVECSSLPVRHAKERHSENQGSAARTTDLTEMNIECKNNDNDLIDKEDIKFIKNVCSDLGATKGQAANLDGALLEGTVDEGCLSQNPADAIASSQHNQASMDNASSSQSSCLDKVKILSSVTGTCFSEKSFEISIPSEQTCSAGIDHESSLSTNVPSTCSVEREDLKALSDNAYSKATNDSGVSLEPLKVVKFGDNDDAHQILGTINSPHSEAEFSVSTICEKQKDVYAMDIREPSCSGKSLQVPGDAHQLNHASTENDYSLAETGKTITSGASVRDFSIAAVFSQGRQGNKEIMESHCSVKSGASENLADTSLVEEDLDVPPGFGSVQFPSVEKAPVFGRGNAADHFHSGSDVPSDTQEDKTKHDGQALSYIAEASSTATVTVTSVHAVDGLEREVCGGDSVVTDATVDEASCFAPFSENSRPGSHGIESLPTTGSSCETTLTENSVIHISQAADISFDDKKLHIEEKKATDCLHTDISGVDPDPVTLHSASVCEDPKNETSPQNDQIASLTNCSLVCTTVDSNQVSVSNILVKRGSNKAGSSCPDSPVEEKLPDNQEKAAADVCAMVDSAKTCLGSSINKKNNSTSGGEHSDSHATFDVNIDKHDDSCIANIEMMYTERYSNVSPTANLSVKDAAIQDGLCSKLFDCEKSCNVEELVDVNALDSISNSTETIEEPGLILPKEADSLYADLEGPPAPAESSHQDIIDVHADDHVERGTSLEQILSVIKQSNIPMMSDGFASIEVDATSSKEIERTPEKSNECDVKVIKELACIVDDTSADLPKVTVAEAGASDDLTCSVEPAISDPDPNDLTDNKGKDSNFSKQLEPEKTGEAVELLASDISNLTASRMNENVDCSLASPTQNNVGCILRSHDVGEHAEVVPAEDPRPDGCSIETSRSVAGTSPELVLKDHTTDVSIKSSRVDIDDR